MAISANWQTAISNIGLPGNFLGLAVTGYCQDRFGSKRTYIGGMALMIAVVFLFVFCQSIEMLLAAEALAAFCWGMFSE
jgi:SP family general alpha glucoside:H+ symporter-like MFS transporter